MADRAKPLWMRKTFWLGLILTLKGLFQGLFPGDEFEFTLGALFSTDVLTGLAIMTGRQAIDKISRNRLVKIYPGSHAPQ